MSSKRECPSCRTVYTGDAKLFCPKDGTRLLDTALRSPPEDTLVGRAIAGRFVLERRLGKGGMGVVYLANHNVLKRSFAVKLLRREFVSNERALARFFREARIASSVDHPNIVSIYDYGQTDKGEPYLVMEYVEGVMLYQAVVDSRTRNLMPAQAVDIAIQVARALEHAHQRGVVHRDIKPENILLTTFHGQADWVKVLDFGVARIVGQPPLTRIGEELIGTPEFIAPEMITTSGEVMPSVDLYALGIMLHDTIVGEPPFRGDIKAVLQGHLKTVPALLSERRRDVAIPQELDELVAQLLEKNPARRPNATEAAQRLEQLRALVPNRTLASIFHQQPTQAMQEITIPPDEQWNGNRTLMLGPDQRGTMQLQGAATLVLSHPGVLSPTDDLSVLSEPAKLKEIEELSQEVEAMVAKLGQHVDELAHHCWPTGWPAEFKAMRDFLHDCQRSQDERELKVAMLQEQMQLQQTRTDKQRQELRQQVMGLSERLQLERSLPESERQKLIRSIEERERALAAVLQSAPTSVEPALNHLQKEIRERRADAQRVWLQLARQVAAQAPRSMAADQEVINLMLSQLETAHSMLEILNQPGKTTA